MADDLHKAMIEDIRDLSSPENVREMMAQFFTRRQYKLQHKKHKYLSRWSHFALTSELVDKVSIKFSPNYSKIQFELENAVKRSQRLEGEDHFATADSRPQRLEPNGQINKDDNAATSALPKHCSLRIDDIDVYTRIVSYETKCNRAVEKFVQRAKWVPISHRFDVFKQYQEYFQSLKQRYVTQQKAYQVRMEQKASSLINERKMGERGHKEMNSIIGAMTFAKQERKAKQGRDKYIQSARNNYQLPPMVVWNQVDLKLQLEDNCKQFNISGDMEVDDGNSFSYTVIVQFPGFFYQQVLKTQFANYDAIPSLQNPAQLGQDIKTVLEENQRKYGKSVSGNTLLEQMEIEKQSSNMKIQYINQIEKALFGEFNNGQGQEFPRVRLKQAHWIPYVCFQPELSTEQMQQAACFVSESNTMDEVTGFIMETLNINDVTHTKLTLESLSQIHYEKLKHGKVVAEFLSLDHSETENYFSDDQKRFFQVFMNSLKSKNDYGIKTKGIQDEDIPKNSLFEASQHLLFANYLVTLLKAREHKTKLLYTLNCFRSIQKRIALELRELGSRDRVTFDCNIVKPKEKNSQGKFSDDVDTDVNNENMTQTMNANKKSKGIDASESTTGQIDNLVLDELVDINRYRCNGMMQNQIFSTCPVIPKYHLAFGEPIERQEVSAEQEYWKGQDASKGQAQKLLGRQDKIELHAQSGCFLVVDDFGVNVMYDCTFNDMRATEAELLRMMSFFINKVEPLQDTDIRSVFPSIDRLGFATDAVSCEEEYQRAKLELIFCYLECYEHTCDSLEQQRLIQIIVDLMAKRPRINLYSNHFKESYLTEIQVFETQTQLLKEFIKMQMDIEQAANDEVRESLEKTYRLISEQMDNKWQYFNPGDIKDEKDKRKIAAVGVQDEKDIARNKQLESAKPGMFQAKQITIDPRQFADMLGMPFSSLQNLMASHHERDPLVQTTLHEDISFIKLQEGYPVFIIQNAAKSHKVKVTPNGRPINMLDIFESLSSVTKVAAVINNATKELYETHRPDNGLMSAAMDLITIQFLLAELKAVRAEIRGDRIGQLRDLDVIEDDSILGNPEKMLFFTKELIAAGEDPNMIQNPFVLTKIDMKTIRDFNFETVQGAQFRSKPKKKRRTESQGSSSHQSDTDIQAADPGQHKVKGKELKAVKEEDSEEPEDINKVNLEELYEKADASELSEGSEEDFRQKQKQHERNKNKSYPRLRARQIRPNIPSMLSIMCNAVEVLRLRQSLIQAYHQRGVLHDIYVRQNKLMGKEGKVFFKDQFNFETHLTGGENWKNFVDSGPGMETFVNTELAIKEFDPSLTAVLNFANPEAFKALVCPLGLEELRVVVHYELANLQALIVAVRHNQLLLDNLERQLVEIDLFSTSQILVAAPTWDILERLVGSNLYESNLQKIIAQDTQKIKQRILLNIGNLSYGIMSRKTKNKDIVERQFKLIRQAVVQQIDDEKVEVTLRYLRTARMMLCHEYCQDMSATIYLDSVRTELMHETQQIRRRAYLLPRESMVHEISPAEYGEWSWANYKEEKQKEQGSSWEFFDDSTKTITNFWTVPSNQEVCLADLGTEFFKALNKLGLFQYKLGNPQQPSKDDQPEFFVENQAALIKSKLPKLTQLSVSEAESQIEDKNRFIDFSEAYDYQKSKVTQYLMYFRQFQNLFDLEFFFNKLPSRAHSMAGLEQAVMSGISFWEESEEALFNDDEYQNNESNDPQYSNQTDDVTSSFKNKLAEQLAQRIVMEKRFKNQLVNELDTMKETFHNWSKRMKQMDLHLDMNGAAKFLGELVQINYYNMLQTLISLRDDYCKRGVAQKELHIINSLVKTFSHQDDSKITYTNGFHVNHAAIAVQRISLDESPNRPDYQNFYRATQPLIDEQGLNPTEFTLLQNLNTVNSHSMRTYRKIKTYAGILPQREFSYLDMRLFNLDQEIRKYISTNISQNDTQAKQFAHSRLRVDEKLYNNNLQVQMQVFLEKRTFMRLFIRSSQMKRALLILMLRNTLPTNVDELKHVWAEFNDNVNWKVTAQIDQIEENRKKQKELAARRQADAESQRLSGIKQIQQQISGNLSRKEQVDITLMMYDKFNCEVDVYGREISNYMILTSQRLINREQTALAKAFEMNGKVIHCLIRPQQQFAACFDQETDSRNHLDIINKMGPVQKMLTQFRNRCLIIETLTSGQGVVISSKDMNECFKELARSLVKNTEIEMRTRCEQLSIIILQYENLLYSKDQQLLNMEAKLIHAKDELNKIVNTKVFQRGNNLIYELDHSNRQLRLMKDNVYNLEKQLKDKIKLRYEKDLDQTRLELLDQKKKFGEYKAALNSTMNGEIKENINEIDSLIKAMHKSGQDGDQKQDLMQKYAHLLKGDAKKQYKDYQQYGGSFDSADLTGIFEELEYLKSSEKEAREEVLLLQVYLRKQRMMQNLKWVLEKQKHEFKVDNLKMQLTSNSTLWEQLAEAEKREKILKQELENSQRTITTHEKIIEHLKDQIKTTSRDNQKLQQYKSTKVKRLDELEAKAKEFEVLENVDLTKLLSLIERKETRIRSLESTELEHQVEIEAFYKVAKDKVRRAEGKANKEAKVKEQALDALKEMRLKTSLLQGEDETMQAEYWRDKFVLAETSLVQIKDEYDNLIQSIRENINLSLKMENSSNLLLGPLTQRSPSLDQTSKLHDKSIDKDHALTARYDLSTQISNDAFKKKQSIQQQSKIPRLLNGSINLTSQQSQQYLTNNQKSLTDNLVHLPALRAKETAEKEALNSLKARNHSVINNQGPIQLANLPGQLPKRLHVFQPQSLTKKASSGLIFEENINAYQNAQDSIMFTPLKGVKVGSSVTPIKNMHGRMAFGQDQFGAASIANTSFQRNQIKNQTQIPNKKPQNVFQSLMDTRIQANETNRSQGHQLVIPSLGKTGSNNPMIVTSMMVASQEEPSTNEQAKREPNTLMNSKNIGIQAIWQSQTDLV